MNYLLPPSSKVDKIKLISFDLDGTLLGRNKEISKNTCEFLIQLQEKGYTIALASGRFLYEIEPYIKQLKLREYNGIAICANGLEVHDFSDDSLHYFQKLTKEEVFHIIDEAKRRNITCYLNYQNEYYISFNSFYESIFFLLKCIFYPCKTLLKNNYYISLLYGLKTTKNIYHEIGDLHKICFFASFSKLKALETEINTWNKPYVFYFVNRKATEITHNTVGKWQAIQYVCEKRNIPTQSVMAFGDSGNDLNLLKNAGIGVAMKNAFSEVKQVTPYQTFETNNNEGIYDYLKSLFK